MAASQGVVPWMRRRILANSGANRISNYGTISALTETTIQLLDGVSEYAGFGNIIVNDGLITSAATYTIYVESTGGDRLQNSGVIIGNVTFVSGSDTVLNSDTIDGNLDFGIIGGDVLRNSGTITGNVIFGASFQPGNFVHNSGMKPYPLDCGFTTSCVDSCLACVVFSCPERRHWPWGDRTSRSAAGFGRLQTR